MKAIVTRMFVFTALTLFLAACGGGGGGSSRSLGEEVPINIDKSQILATYSLELFTDSSTLRTNGTDSTNITAVVRDKDGVVVPDVSVNIAADSGVLSAPQTVTDSSGKVTATLSTPDNPANRTITITANLVGADVSDSTTVDVTGSTVSLSGGTSMVIDDTQTLTISLRDANNTGIANQTVHLQSALGNRLSDTSPQTDASGTASVTYYGDIDGDDTIMATAFSGTTATALAVNISAVTFKMTQIDTDNQPIEEEIPLNQDATIKLTWNDPDPVENEDVEIILTRGTINDTGSNIATVTTDGNGEAEFTVTSDNAGPSIITAVTPEGLTSQLSVEFVATTADVVSVSASPATISTNQQSTIRAVVRDAAGNLVKGKKVAFNIVKDITKGTLSPAFAETDSNGFASTVYTGGSTVSGKDEVEVKATVIDEQISDTVYLTVAESPVSITIGTGNEIFEPDTTTYEKDFALSVSDATGTPIPNKTLQVAVTPVLPSDGNGIAYYKGYREWSEENKSWITVITAECQNEDLNLNGILDAGDNDVNNNGTLEPGNNVLKNADSVVTDSNGWATVKLRYSQQYASYLQVKISVTADVSGTEAVKEQVWRTVGLGSDFSEQDISPPGPVSPFGTSNSCADEE